MAVLEPRKLLTLPHLLAPQTSGGLPRIFYVSPAGNDNNYGPAGAHRYNPLLTIAQAAAKITDNRGDIIAIGPGAYAETLTLAARKAAFIGLGASPALVAITGSATQTGPTVSVPDGYGNGFLMENLSIGAGAARPCLSLETSDTGDMTATAADYHFTLRNVHLGGGGTANAGLLIRGATGVRFLGGSISDATYGIVLTGSVSNNPANLLFEDVDFFDNVTWDVGVATTVTANGATITPGTLGSISYIKFRECEFEDGTGAGTPVTNYCNIGASNNVTNVGFTGCVFARDIGNGTLFVTGPTGLYVARCYSPAGLESFVA